MGRLIVVVLVLVAIAFLVNKYILGKGDELPQRPAARADDAGPDGPAAADAQVAGEEEAPVEPVTEEEGVEIAAESEVADAAPAATVVPKVERTRLPADPAAAAENAAVAGAEATN